MKITSARITELPKTVFDPIPVVFVTTEDGVEHRLFQYYPDEISFKPEEFLGLTLDDAARLKYAKDQEYLKSPGPAGNGRPKP
jgi:hypothetical protein